MSSKQTFVLFKILIKIIKIIQIFLNLYNFNTKQNFSNQVCKNIYLGIGI